MLLEQLIDINIPTISSTDSVDEILSLFNENNFTQLPLLVNDEYKELVEKKDYGVNKQLAIHNEYCFKPAISITAHPFDAVKLFYQQHLTVLPVINQDGKYLGCITPQKLLHYFAEQTSFSITSGILILAIEARNYSLAEIARLCENEDVTILSSNMIQNRITEKIEVTLKTNKIELSALVASFERHGYTINAVYGAPTVQDDLQEKYLQLMNYLNI